MLVRVIRTFILAIQFGTIFPTPQLEDVKESELRISVVWFPVIGFLLGLLMWLVLLGILRVLPTWPANVLVLTMYTGLTGALHMDGLMDTMDAIGSRRKGLDALAIMKDSRVGAIGVVAGILLLGGKLVALTSLSRHGIGVITMVPMISRLSMVWSMALASSARGKSGLGGLYAQQIPAWVIQTATALTMLFGLFLLPWQHFLVLLLSAAALSWIFTQWMKHRFGGTTGDTYGALNEIIEWFGWNLLCIWR